MRHRHSHAISGAFALVLLGVFAVSSAMLALFGAQVYRAAVDRSNAHNDRRVLAAMVRNAVRADDAGGVLSVVEIGGATALRFSSEVGGEKYDRYLYVHDGALREMFISADRTFEPGEGEAICAATSMRAEWADGLLTVSLVDGRGEECEVVLAPRAGT